MKFRLVGHSSFLTSWSSARSSWATFSDQTSQRQRNGSDELAFRLDQRTGIVVLREVADLPAHLLTGRYNRRLQIVKSFRGMTGAVREAPSGRTAGASMGGRRHFVWAMAQVRVYVAYSTSMPSLEDCLTIFITDM